MTMGGHIQLAGHATLELQQFQQTRVLIHGTRNNYGSVKKHGETYAVASRFGNEFNIFLI